MTPNFAEKLQTYIENVRSARKSQVSERQISHLFLGFISDAFGVKYEDVELEHHVTMTKVQKHGYVDALLGDLLIEFKRDINTELGSNIEQLRNYMRDMPDLHRYVGMLADGIDFRTYVLDDSEDVREVDQFTISNAEPDAVYLWLDAYLFSRANIEPTADDIVQRFGVRSPTFQLVQQTLSRLLNEIQEDKELDVWRGQWKALLSKVYGSDIADDNLFIRHTYLSQFAKLLVFAALQGRPDKLEIPSIVNGEAFHQHGVSNIGENDFFSWLMMSDIRAESINFLYALSAELQVYDLSAIRQDLLKQLYQDLVDPETRHDLGEYYTPDWLAQLTLEEIDYRAPQSLLDPACGSGTFLFNAIRRLADNGLTGRELVEFALNNIVGTDVHPLAVTIARINYLLAITEHLMEDTDVNEILTLPVYMADALIIPQDERSLDSITIPVNPSDDEIFRIPLQSSSDPQKLSHAIQQLDEFANLANGSYGLNESVATFKRVISYLHDGLDDPAFLNLWASNLRLLAKLIREKRNRIWSYVLSNMAQPLILAKYRFDVVAGNPPWLSYRYINSAAGQAEVKRLSIHYKLIEPENVTLFTQMDMSTLFFAHARDQYLKRNGTLAFVMPRSVITGAKQHRLFQRQGFTRILDVLEVAPLFKVPSAVLIHSTGNANSQDIPTTSYRASLPRHELPLSEARPHLEISETTTRFVDTDSRSPYFERFVEGATLVPRNLTFVRPAGIPSSPAIETDPALNQDAKPPWKGIRLQGTVHNDYVYATLLSKHLLPFGFQKLNMVALPVRVRPDGKLELLHEVSSFADKGHISAYTQWFSKTHALWEKQKKSKMTLVERYDFHKLLSKQANNAGFTVLYNASGSNIACCVLNLDTNALRVYLRKVAGFVVDYTCFHYFAPTEVEAHYLCAILNSPFVNEEIKAHQPEGLWGARHIQRTPFEACAIPIFDAGDPDHLELARLSILAHQKIEEMKGMEENQLLNGGPGRARNKAREIVADELNAIDKIARLMLEE